MTRHFTSFSTVFQSYQDAGKGDYEHLASAIVTGDRFDSFNSIQSSRARRLSTANLYIGRDTVSGKYQSRS